MGVYALGLGLGPGLKPELELELELGLCLEVVPRADHDDDDDDDHDDDNNSINEKDSRTASCPENRPCTVLTHLNTDKQIDWKMYLSSFIRLTDKRDCEPKPGRRLTGSASCSCNCSCSTKYHAKIILDAFTFIKALITAARALPVPPPRTFLEISQTVR